MSQLYVDQDGVLADFNSAYEGLFGVVPDRVLGNINWKKIAAIGDFYWNLPPMHDMRVLWAVISKHNPIILTGVPVPAKQVPEAANNKRAWAHAQFGNDQKIICCPSSEKSLHCLPGDILIDDYVKYRHLWVAAGGEWITHKTAENTIDILREDFGIV